MEISTFARGIAFSFLLAAHSAPEAHAQQGRELPPELKAVRTLDAYFAEVATIAPDFAGLYVRGDDLVIRVAAPSGKLTEALQKRNHEAVEKVFGQALDRFKGAKRLYEPADFAMKDLLAWREALGRQGGALRITSLDVKESESLIDIAIDPEADEKVFWQAVEKAGIDRKAVRLQRLRGAIRGDDVGDRIRPMVAGLRIKGRSRCTVGMFVDLTDLGGRGLITNSHCSDLDGIVDGIRIKQPGAGFAGANAVATEIADPPFTVAHPDCMTGESCRFSDAMVAKIDDNDASSRGRIARIGNWGGFEISSVDPDYEITSLVFVTMEGERLTKIGNSTGKTAGEVTSTCSDWTPIDPTSQLTAIRMLCQNVVRSMPNIGGGQAQIFDLGDSGSPVFRLDGLGAANPSHHVELHGILWGSTSANGANFIFSPILLTYLELFPAVGLMNFLR